MTAVLDVWDNWSLYPPHSLLACRTSFSGKDVANTLDGEELDMSMFETAGEDEAEQQVQGDGAGAAKRPPRAGVKKGKKTGAKPAKRVKA